MKKEDVNVYRQNVVTLIEGKRKKTLFDQGLADKNYEKNERKFGDFALSFKIPDEYERKWNYYEVEEGILCIKYKRDSDSTDKDQTIILDKNTK